VPAGASGNLIVHAGPL